MNNLLSDLNVAQRRAVEHDTGPLLVLAGPGSGKTRVVTRRIAYNITARHVSPGRLLAITFTNRAAMEMKRRVESLVGSEAPVQLGTFHWMSHALLRRHIGRIGLRSDFRLLDPSEARQALRTVVPRDGSVRLTDARSAISAVKNGADPRDAAERSRLNTELLLPMRESYDAALRRIRGLDLDDLLVLAVRVLREDAEARQFCRRAFDEILVDEYQDTNPVQRDLLRLLAPETGAVVAVGDDDQAIYSWRQADVHNILSFPDDFPGTTIIRLEETYRSTKRIVRAASALVEHNHDRLPKHLRTANEAGEKPVVFAAADEVDEARWITAEIVKLNSLGYSWNDIAVLYRVNAQSRAIEAALATAAVPYRVRAGRRYYERPEIRQAIAYLRVALDPTDRAAAIILLEALPGMGQKRLETLTTEAAAEPVLAYVTDHATVRGVPAPVLDAARGVADRAAAVQAARESSLVTVLNHAIKAVEPDLEALPALEREAALENLAELSSAAGEMGHTRGTLRAFLQNVTLVGETGDSGEGVTLMSLHAAKGTEYRMVFIAGVEEGLLPHRRSLEREAEIDEERRLCYVGMTRARERLALTYAHLRLLGGHALIGHGSRFITEIGGTHLELRTSGRAVLRPRLLSVRAGQVIEHQRWGPGTVIAVEGTGRDTLVTIAFESVGRQRLQLCHAPLRVAESRVDVLAG